MATRGAIARRTGEHTFTGIYHHWDSYPEGLGKTLFELYNGFFKRDLDAMLRVLLDEHPAGWSTINGADFSLPAGYHNTTTEEIANGTPKGPACYCHGDRNETGNEVTEETASDTGCEFVYVFDVHERIGDQSQANALPEVRMLITTNYARNRTAAPDTFGTATDKWRTIAIVDLNGNEPNWESIREE